MKIIRTNFSIIGIRNDWGLFVQKFECLFKSVNIYLKMLIINEYWNELFHVKYLYFNCLYIFEYKNKALFEVFELGEKDSYE